MFVLLPSAFCLAGPCVPVVILHAFDEHRWVCKWALRVYFGECNPWNRLHCAGVLRSNLTHPSKLLLLPHTRRLVSGHFHLPGQSMLCCMRFHLPIVMLPVCSDRDPITQMRSCRMTGRNSASMWPCTLSVLHLPFLLACRCFTRAS